MRNSDWLPPAWALTRDRTCSQPRPGPVHDSRSRECHLNLKSPHHASHQQASLASGGVGASEARTHERTVTPDSLGEGAQDDRPAAPPSPITTPEGAFPLGWVYPTPLRSYICRADPPDGAPCESFTHPPLRPT